MIKTRVILPLLVLFVVLFGGMFLRRRASSSATQQGSVLVVAMMSGWAPFMTINGAGQFEGFDVDVAQEIAQRMNRQLVIEDLGSLPACFIALDQQRVAMVLSDLDITQKRLERVAMIRYTGQEEKQYGLMFWNEIPAGMRSLDDIKNFSDAVICVESGSSQEKFLDYYGFVTKKRMNSMMDMVLDIRFGKSFAAVAELRIAARLARQNPEIKILPIDLPQDFQVLGCGIALKKENVQLIDDVSRVITQMYNDGTLARLEKKWQLEE